MREAAVTETRTKSAFGWLQIVNAVVWTATILVVAVTAKASDNLIYVLLLLIVCSSISWTAINAADRRDRAT
jgi:hypothetical protein